VTIGMDLYYYNYNIIMFVELKPIFVIIAVHAMMNDTTVLHTYSTVPIKYIYSTTMSLKNHIMIMFAILFILYYKFRIIL
jgi:hypothetical protein